NPELQDKINVNARVNFKANDSPMEGHLIVDRDEKTIEGGAGLIENPDVEISGPTDVLVGMLTGDTDPVQGFMAGEFEMDGSIQKGTQLASVMDVINEELRA
ncbi:MAG: SCP2 sterol-binding domain-containing protein, partial [Halobacteria archaeon]|nr:SCP2 sterol-binding domain-containing protein [Halobacteria archaeon]